MHRVSEAARGGERKAKKGKADPRFEFPKPAELVFEAKVRTDDDEGGTVAHIGLRLDPKCYWPVGHARYGGWVLYQDMPYATVPAVVSAVFLLASDLASLRYPIGEEGTILIP